MVELDLTEASVVINASYLSNKLEGLEFVADQLVSGIESVTPKSNTQQFGIKECGSYQWVHHDQSFAGQKITRMEDRETESGSFHLRYAGFKSKPGADARARQ